MEKDIQNDQELYSYFVQRNATLCEDNFSYLMEHKEVKLMISDYLSNLLLQKPDDVFKFTKDYFRILSDKPEVNKILIVVGPNGVGKTSLVQKLINSYPDKFEFPVYTTTKINKIGETKFYTAEKEKFLEMINDNDLIDYTFDNDEYEGISKKEIGRIFNEGKVSILELEISEVNKFYNNGVEATYIAIVPSSMDSLRERIKNSKKGNTAAINKILDSSAKEITEMATSSFFSHKIINDDLETGYDDFKNSVMASFPFLKENYKDIKEMARSRLEEIHKNDNQIVKKII